MPVTADINATSRRVMAMQEIAQRADHLHHGEFVRVPLDNPRDTLIHTAASALAQIEAIDREAAR